MAVTLNQEQFNQFLAEIIAKIAQSTTSTSTSTTTGKGRTISEKGFQRVKKFSHGEAEWQEWSFDYKTALGAQSVDMREYLEAVEKHADIVAYESAAQWNPEKASHVNLMKLNAELYDTLVLTTDGEAKLMVKASAAGDGIQAWSRLCRHFNKRTVARMLRLHREVMHPKQVALDNLVSAIMEWEEKWRRMEAEMVGGTAIPQIWKMGAFLELCPTDVQDLVFQNLNDIGEDYGKLMQKVVAFASNKVASMSGPVPMDVGGVKRNEEECDECRGVDAVNRTFQCYNCGGWGHSQRECPSRHVKGKGKGKGQRADDEGGDGSKGKGKGGKGGKGGYLGKCWTCGKVGHKSHECRSGARRIGAVGGEEEEDEEFEGGECEQGAVTVWTMGNVTVVKDENPEQPSTPTTTYKSTTNAINLKTIFNHNHPPAPTTTCSSSGKCSRCVNHNHLPQLPIPTKNRFEALSGDDEDDGDEDDGDEMEDKTVVSSLNVNHVEVGEVKAKKLKKRGEITLDSGAGASCWPEPWLPNVELKPKKAGVKFIGAEGSEMKYKGRKNIRFRPLRSENGEIVKGSLSEMEFHVTNSTKALASAAAVVDAGNDVYLTGRKGGSYIENVKSGERVYLKRKGGTFVFDVEFMDAIGGDEDVSGDVDMGDRPMKKSFQRQGAIR